jgi:Do/DeqQ family serine protease
MFRPVVAAALIALFPAMAGAETRAPLDRGEISLSFAPVVREVTPSVVNIYAQRVVEGRPSLFADDPFFGEFFRSFGPSAPRVQNSLGSGVIVSQDGLVVSNYHVVGAATEITVILADRREFRADVVLADADSDLAVLRLRGATGLTALPLRDSDGVEVGELVLAIGNPFGLGQTVSMGIVSGLARSALSVGDGRGYFLQTDAAINPGNSGGALVDGGGRLLGINTAILTQSGGSNGIGFAIPANLVRAVIEQAQAGQDRFVRPWAGVTGQQVDGALAEGLGLRRPEGVILASLHPDSPFSKAGLKPGDVIVALGDLPVNSPPEMIFRMASTGVGRSIEATYLRNGAEQTVRVDLIAPPDSPDRQTRKVDDGSVLDGLAVARINPAVAAELGLSPEAEGIVVTDHDDRMARVGLRVGDVLLAINGEPVRSTDDVLRLSRDRTRNWALDVQRGGGRVSLRFRV